MAKLGSTIKIAYDTKRSLADIGKKGESYDDIIQWLLRTLKDQKVEGWDNRVGIRREHLE